MLSEIRFAHLPEIKSDKVKLNIMEVYYDHGKDEKDIYISYVAKVPSEVVSFYKEKDGTFRMSLPIDLLEAIEDDIKEHGPNDYAIYPLFD